MKKWLRRKWQGKASKGCVPLAKFRGKNQGDTGLRGFFKIIFVNSREMTVLLLLRKFHFIEVTELLLRKKFPL